MSRLNHTEKHLGTYINKAGDLKAAYLMWRDDKQGFVIYDADTNRVLQPTAYKNLAELKLAGVDFTLTKHPIKTTTQTPELSPVA